MNLKRKLLTVFGALAVLSLVTAGITFWMLARWYDTAKDTDDHFQRSLLVQRIRAATYRAFKEVPDAVSGDDVDSRKEFDVYIKPALEDFEHWTSLANTDEEKQEIRLVRAAFDVLIEGARQTFTLVEAGKRSEAAELMEGKLEDQDFVEFQFYTDAVVESDRSKRQIIRAENEMTRSTARIVLTVIAFATVSLVLLLAAYLSSDLFRPLKELETALERATRGDLKQALPEDRNDEFGAINRNFNRMLETTRRRERAATEKTTGELFDVDADETNGDELAARINLHALVNQIRSEIIELTDISNAAKNDGKADSIVRRLDRLSQAVVRVSDFGFPLDLNLSQTDVRNLLYEATLRFYDELRKRGISLELEIGAEVGKALIDRLKIRETINELIRNSLRALPENGGKLGLRTRIVDGNLLIEVADNGNPDDDKDVFEREGSRPQIGLRLSKAVVEQHGGKLIAKTETNIGTIVQISLPLREES